MNHHVTKPTQWLMHLAEDFTEHEQSSLSTKEAVFRCNNTGKTMTRRIRILTEHTRHGVDFARVAEKCICHLKNHLFDKVVCFVSNQRKIKWRKHIAVNFTVVQIDNSFGWMIVI